MKLVIAEKPSVAMSLAAVLGATERKDGYLEGSGYLVSWCVGHLLELAQPEAYKEQYAKWRYEDLPILPENWKYEVPKDKKKQLALLCRLMKDKRVDSVVCATDAGREGELIFRLVYEYAGCNKPMERLWISSMEDAAIREGFDHLRPGSDYDKLYDAAVCRAGADWLIGINATRLFSVLYGVTLNVGRVMSPTLALLVQRESDIESFISKPFYVPEITCGGFTASGEKMTERSEAEKIRMDCDHNSAFVRSAEKQVKTIQPPRLYDLTTLQRECNRIYGYTAQQTLDYVQSLYEKKLATYPRTDSQYLTKDMQATAASLILWLRDNMPFGKGCAGEPDIDRVTDDSKVTDHHAIIPTVEIARTDLSELPSGERDVLTLLLNEEQKNALMQYILEQGACHGTVFNSCHTSFAAKKNPLTEIQEGELYLCLEHRTVRVRERMINLTSKEFDILALLIANPKRVFTYELITDLVWKEDCDFYSRKAIHNHISKLRKKLRFEPDLPNYIESVAGIGYKFEHL